MTFSLQSICTSFGWLAGTSVALVACSGTVTIFDDAGGGDSAAGAGGSSTSTAGQGGSSAGSAGAEQCLSNCPWSTTFGAPWTRSLALSVAPDGGAVVASETYTPSMVGDTVEDTRFTRLDAKGHVLWEVAAPLADGAAFDEQGNLFVSASVHGSGMLFGASFSCQAERCALVARLDSDGVPTWTHFYDPGPGGHLRAQTLGLATDGHLVLVGALQGTCDFGAGPIVGTDQDTFAAALSPDGSGLWSRILLSDGGKASVSATGDIAVVGGSAYSVDFGEGPVSPPPGTLGVVPFVAEYDSSGELRFGKFFGGVWPQWPGSCTTAFGDADSLLVACDLGVDFGEALPPGPGFALAKLDSQGQPVWTTAVPGDRPFKIPTNIAMAVDAQGRVYVGGVNGALLQYDSAGSPLSIFPISTTGEAYCELAQIGPSGSPVVAGNFNGLLDLGQGALDGGDIERIGFAAALSP